MTHTSTLVLVRAPEDATLEQIDKATVATMEHFNKNRHPDPYWSADEVPYGATEWHYDTGNTEPPEPAVLLEWLRTSDYTWGGPESSEQYRLAADGTHGCWQRPVPRAAGRAGDGAQVRDGGGVRVGHAPTWHAVYLALVYRVRYTSTVAKRGDTNDRGAHTMAHTTSTATTDLLDGPADTLLQEDHAAAAYWLAIENAENLRAHGPVAGEDDMAECDDCATVRSTYARLVADPTTADEVLDAFATDNEGDAICAACALRYVGIHYPQEGE